MLGLLGRAPSSLTLIVEYLKGVEHKAEETPRPRARSPENRG